MAIHYDENLYKTWTMSPPLTNPTIRYTICEKN